MDQALGSMNHPWERFFRTLFWLGVIMAGVSILQYLLLLMFAHLHWRTPIMAVFPRPQLFVILLGLPALVQAAARKQAASVLLSTRLRADALPKLQRLQLPSVCQCWELGSIP